MPNLLKHDYPFDPSYGYSLADLQAVRLSQKAPSDFSHFWKQHYKNALKTKPYLCLQDQEKQRNGWRIFDIHYDSTDGVRIGGWLLLPQHMQVERAVVWAHGYGGVDTPDTSWTLSNTALLIPCARGIGRSQHPPISDQPQWHVLHDIQDPQRYVIKGCVQDLWCGISALLRLFPQVEGKIGLMGSSFGAGLAIFASAFDKRVARCHFHVPTFANTQLRLQLPTVGSGQSLREFASSNPELIATTLPYFDAAFAAKYLKQPSHWALAAFDPFVAPPGQFSAYNHAGGDRQLLVLKAGHFSYRGQRQDEQAMRQQVEGFMSALGA